MNWIIYFRNGNKISKSDNTDLLSINFSNVERTIVSNDDFETFYTLLPTDGLYLNN